MGDKVLKYGEKISKETRAKISRRYKTVTRAINDEFWDSANEIAHSLYVGSYGRNTAIKTSDIDILVELPNELFDHCNNLAGNSQSRLLQTVKKAILTAYPRSDIRADGQVIKIHFTDGMVFEIVPAFKKWDGSYKYPDSNAGGSWKSTDPKAEQTAMAEKNRSSNGLLYDTCRHIRFIRDNKYSSYCLSGIVIDSFVYNAIGSWRWREDDKPSNAASKSYEQYLLDYYNADSFFLKTITIAPGTNEIVDTKTSYECLGKVLKSMV